MKIALVCAHGGHFSQAMQLLEAFSGYDFFIATCNSPRMAQVKSISRAYFIENIGTNIWRMFKTFFWALGILLHEKPQVIISLGSEIAIPFFYLGKIFNIRTLYIESFTRIEDLSLTGKIVFPVADAFWVQWPQLLEVYGSKAEYHGAVI